MSLKFPSIGKVLTKTFFFFKCCWEKARDATQEMIIEDNTCMEVAIHQQLALPVDRLRSEVSSLLFHTVVRDNI